MQKPFNILPILLMGSLLGYSCKNQTSNEVINNTKEKITMKDTTDNYWKEKLTPEEYHVLREKGTERPFTGKYNDFFEEGTYVCAACGAKLFESTTKFESSCGWPSFDDAIDGAVKYTKDTSHGMQRVEVTCATCGGHLGHVFDDGPKDTTGLRYCTNSISIKFVPKE